MTTCTKSKRTLTEFVRDANPIPDDDHSKEPMGGIWDEYMGAATNAHNNAQKAMIYGDSYSAYWNAMNAIGCYAAAYAALEAGDAVSAHAQATAAYFVAVRETQANCTDLSVYGERISTHG